MVVTVFYLGMYNMTTTRAAPSKEHRKGTRPRRAPLFLSRQDDSRPPSKWHSPQRELDRHDATAATKVVRCTSDPLHKGLFATQDIPKGSIVAKFNDIRRLDRDNPDDKKLIDAHHNRKPGGDRTVAIGRSFYTDRGFAFKDKVFTSAPKWYRMNHANKTSASSTFDTEGMYWIAKRQIRKNQPITWDYGEVPGMWGKKDFCEEPLKK